MLKEKNIKFTVCLNMIVKNERNVIKRCLESVKHIIDYWVIVDTGSTDGTQEIIRDFMKDVPGELHERPWKNFGYNRSEALTLAREKADYCFMIDADEIVSFDENFTWEFLGADSFLIRFDDNGLSYQRCQLVNNRLQWHYVGVLHEYVYCEKAEESSTYPGIKIIRYLDGSRSSDPQKFKKDVLVLEQGLLEEPNNERYVFYLAQSYKDAGDIDQAIKNYERRVGMGGWNQEVWFSLYQVAQLKEKKGEEWPEVMQAYLKAYQFYPARVGPLFRIMCHYMYHSQDYHLAYIFAQQAIKIKQPDDILFVEEALYEWNVPLEFAVCSYWVGNHEEAIKWNNKLLNERNTPPNLVPQIISNRKFSLDKVYPKHDPPLNIIRPIKVVILFHNPGNYLDNCIERLLEQSYPKAQFLFVDNGSTDGSASKIPIEDERIDLISVKKQIPEYQLFQEYISDKLNDDDLVLIQSGQDWFSSGEVLNEINQSFNERDCQILYSQFRQTNGQLGNAIPFHSADSIPDGLKNLEIPLLCVKAGLIKKWLHEESPEINQKNETLKIERALFRYAGFSRIQFDDNVWIVHSNTNSSVPGNQKEKMITNNVEQILSSASLKNIS